MSANVRIEKAVPDTSVIIEGILSRNLKKFGVKHIVFHEAVLAELESQANKGRETGYLGLEEIARLRKICSKLKVKIEYKGSRPGDFEIKFAKSGEIDSLIRDLAFREKATLVTADIVQSKVAQAKGIKVYLHKFKTEKEGKMLVEKFFDRDTLRVDFAEDDVPVALKGVLGSLRSVKLGKAKISRDRMLELIFDVVEKARSMKNSFLDYEKKSCIVARVDEFRISIVKPPFSSSYAMTVKRLVSVGLKKFRMSDSGFKAVMASQGLAVVGGVDSGKTTFMGSLASSVFGSKVCIVSSSGGVFCGDCIFLYSANSSPQEIKDALFVRNPARVFFDEVRDSEDIRLFSDLRVAGFNVVASFSARDEGLALEKLVYRQDIGLVDALVFMQKGVVERVLRAERKSSSKVVFYDVDSGAAVFEVVRDSEGCVVIPKF